MEEKELTPMEALEILYEERAFTYNTKVCSKSKSWSEDIKHYDRIGEALITLRKALEEREELKEALKVCKYFSNEISQYCKETLKDKKMMKGGYAYQICCKWKDGLKKSFEMLGDGEDE